MESSPYYIAFRGHSSIARSEKKKKNNFILRWKVERRCLQKTHLNGINWSYTKPEVRGMLLYISDDCHTHLEHF